MRDCPGIPSKNLRAIFQPPPGRHRPRSVSVAERCPELGRQHPGREYTWKGVYIRSRAPCHRSRSATEGRTSEGQTMKSTSLLLVDDDTAFRQVMAGELSRLGYEVDAVGSGEEAIQRVAAVEPEVVLLDLHLPGIGGLETLKAIQAATPTAEVIMLTGHGSIDTAIESIRIGAFDYVVKPCPLDELQIRIQRAIERRSLRQRANLLDRVLTPPNPGNSFIGDSPEFRRLINLIERVAPSDSTVLITGETGAGKERVAKLIHARSSRRSRPFVVVECAALQENLLQSELFGHERGAFTGADRAKPGLFEVAHGGTIFLDEIG